jgi:hypothetical protein
VVAQNSRRYVTFLQKQFKLFDLLQVGMHTEGALEKMLAFFGDR